MQRKAQRPGRIVARSGGNDAQRNPAAISRTGERVDSEVDHAIAAHHHKGVRTRFQCALNGLRQP